MTARRPRRCAQAGFAMFLVLGYVAAVGLLASVFLRSVHLELQLSAAEERSRTCRHLAEAGVNKAIASLRSDAIATGGETGLPLGNGFVDVAIEPLAQAGRYRIQATGFFEAVHPGSARRASETLQVEVERSAGSIRIVSWDAVP